MLFQMTTQRPRKMADLEESQFDILQKIEFVAYKLATVKLHVEHL